MSHPCHVYQAELIVIIKDLEESRTLGYMVLFSHSKSSFINLSNPDTLDVLV